MSPPTPYPPPILPYTSSAHHYLFHRTHFTHDGKEVTPEFDFIVVGGGPAGCALASRLSLLGVPEIDSVGISRQKGFSVLLLEEGTTVHQNPELQNIAAHTLQTRSLHGSSFDYAYPTDSTAQFCAKDIVLNSGKVLGGSSCINWAIWTRGSKDDFDLWARLVEDDSYSWNAMLPVFRKIETFSFPSNFDVPGYDASLHGTCGPISIRPISASSRSEYNKWSSIAEKCFDQSGFRRLHAVGIGINGLEAARSEGGTLDINAGFMLGYGEIQESVANDGKRATANAYLEIALLKASLRTNSHVPSGNHPNSGTNDGGSGLDVWTGVHVQKVVFEEDRSTSSVPEIMPPRAVGVDTNRGFIKARREVILTAGAIRSAHILLQSGIGPAKHLKEHDIPIVVANEQVGQNLWDHPVVDIQFKLKHQFRGDTAEDLASARTAGSHLEEWVKKGTGFISGLPYEWIGFTNLKSSIENHLSSQVAPLLSVLDRSVLLRSTIPHVEHFLHYGHGLTAAPDPLLSSYIAISSVLLCPLSRGFVELRNSVGGSQTLSTTKSKKNCGYTGFIGTARASDTEPRIVLNQLKEPLDRCLMQQAVELSFKLLRAPIWQEYLEQKDIPSADDLLELIRERVTTLWHVGGTCSMKTSVSQGVVDSQMRVIGVSGLRVADTSIIPFPLAAHTQAISYVLGEKASHLIGLKPIQQYKRYTGC